MSEYICLLHDSPACDECIKQMRVLEQALKDIMEFHDKNFEELEKTYGFLGWTCCGQKKQLAKSALESAKEALK